MDELSAAIEFFMVHGNLDFQVSGPMDLGPDGVLPKLCIIQASGPAIEEELVSLERVVSYTLRFYGPSDLAALDAYKEVREATFEDAKHIFPKTFVKIQFDPFKPAKILKWFQVSAPTGPIQEPETDRWIVVATGRAKWTN